MENIGSWLILAFRLWLIVCVIIYTYWLIKGKLREKDEKITESNRLTFVIGTGAFISLLLTVYNGLGATFPLVRGLFYYWWEGDIEIPIHIALSIIISIWIVNLLNSHYCEMPKIEKYARELEEYNRELQIQVNEIKRELSMEIDISEDETNESLNTDKQ